MVKEIKIRHEHALHDLTSVAQTAMPVVRQLLGQQGLQTVELLRAWRSIVGPQLAQYTLPCKLVFKKDERSNGCLTLMTISGAFAMEIKQKQQSILNKINSFFGYAAVGSLKIIQTGNPQDFLINKKPFENLKKNVVSDDEENYITELTKDINSPQLRETLQRLGEAVTLQNK